MEKWGFGLSKKEVLETIGRYVSENKMPTPFRGGVPGDDFFIRFKRMHKLSLIKPQSIEACRKKSIDPFIRRMKEAVSKNVKDRNRQEKKKATKTKENSQEERREW